MNSDRAGKAPIIGILGGIGSGKSQVAGHFRKLGAEVVCADELAHEAMKAPEVQGSIVQLFGPEILAEGAIDRKRLARLVFSDPARRENLRKLESVLHPVVRQKIESSLTRATSCGLPAVIDAPLLWEGGLYERCQALVFVDAPLEIRRTRVTRNRGWEPREIEERERFQASLQEKRDASHYVVYNGGGDEETSLQVRRIWADLGLDLPN
jgi:dephospho-CoA kinase